jgi:hypothetical protein
MYATLASVMFCTDSCTFLAELAGVNLIYIGKLDAYHKLVTVPMSRVLACWLNFSVARCHQLRRRRDSSAAEDQGVPLTSFLRSRDGRYHGAVTLVPAVGQHRPGLVAGMGKPQ